MKEYYNRGISLIVLVITIIVIAILATAVIVTLYNTNTLDQSKKAKFMSDYRTVQEGVNLFSLGKYNAATNEFELPLKGHLTAEDKTYISENVPTLKTKIEELSGSIDTVDLAWISSEDIGIKLSANKSEKGYILDVANGLIYDYNGDYFEGQMWHTLDGGVVSGGPGVPGGTIDEELWNGWIKLTLYYPPNSTEKQWRLGTEGELRADPMLMWQNYTGPITIPLDRVKDVWIKYKLDNKEVVIPPAGTLLVDIVPDKTGYTKVPGVKVHINFDETATVKEYRVGDSSWMTYTGEFNVTENCIIEARARKTETIYNTDGTVLTTRNIAGRDLVYIGNIGIEETELEAPTITRLPAVGIEKARVRVTYPANADKKIYKVNYGIEENYDAEINVQNYGTYIIAYYYDSTGKRSQSSGILINDTSTGGTPYPPGPYNPLPPQQPGNPPPVNPDITIPAPNVVVNPTAIAEEVQVSINAPSEADIIYIKLGRYADYQLYTTPITVRENMEVYAYYRTYMGERSNTGYGRVSNIKKNNRPYVRIDADPYPYSWSYGASEVSVTINYSDATTIEYSEDGVVFKPYISAFKVTENKTIYARGTNNYGVTETSLNITNIGKIKPPTPIGNLSVGINVNPEPTVSTTRYTKATVSIDYDTKATEKYYRIGWYGELKPYTGAFEVTSNCTIYAYAKGTNATGSTSKTVDNLSNGISDPVIATSPGGGQQSSKVYVTIEYDKYSKIKRYSINGVTLRDYGGEFEVTKNGSVIYAYSENDVGQKAEARYTVNNIVPEPPLLVLDKGQYYILKLNYPLTSKNREYKWKENGEWKGYKEAGILLLKPQYKDQLIQNGTLVKIEDESGNLITFTGDYYFIDVPISELFENLFMRWDREPLGAPQIVITPTEPAMQVTANIVYSNNLIKKQYKVVNSDGSIKVDWVDYTGSITIDRNNSIVYAKGMDDTEVWTVEAMKKITNIDENPPVISLTADLSTAQQKVAVKAIVTDDVGVGKVKWALGIQGESYFANSGTEIQNNSIVNITTNGYYTFYAEDQVGNKQVYTLNVANVDLTAPVIDIQVNPETTVGLNANVAIDYGDSVTKQYKVGTANSTWTNYTTAFEISSYTILANNWQNADGTVTIYAKGKDSAGNEITVQKKVLSLDLDKPKIPVVVSSAGYANLTLYGVTFNSSVKIIYDNRTDIDNYYSVDSGITWKKYSGEFDMSSGTIIAKSVKKNTSLEVSISQTVSIPTDALAPQAYDGDTNTYTTMLNKYIKVDSSMYNQKVSIKLNAVLYARINIRFMNDSKQILDSFDIVNGIYDVNYTVPNGTAWITAVFIDGTSGQGNLYEIGPSNEPRFDATNGYMLLTADPTKSIREPYQMVTINYFTTSIQRLYKIGATGDWLNYNDQPIKVKQGETIYAKGIDQYGKETRVVSSYTANVIDALPSQVYDNNDSTYIANVANKYMLVDSSMQGKNIRVRFNGYTGSGTWGLAYISFLDENKTLISQFGGPYSYNEIITVPNNAKWILISVGGSGYNTFYEIQAANEPVITPTTVYMLLSADPTRTINEPYQNVQISYFPTSVQKLYKIGIAGNWLSYNNQPIKLMPGETIYAKGIDQYGNETRVISSYVGSITDALPKEAMDGNDNTYTSMLGKYIKIDSNMQGKNIRLKLNAVLYARINVKFMNESKQIISSFDIVNTLFDGNVNIPNGTVWMSASFTDGTSNQGNIYEIQLANEPTFTNVGKKYMLITYDPANAVKEPKQLISINYYPNTIQRLYRIGTTGNWLNYNDQPIEVKPGETIYAKGIDQYGKETRTASMSATNIVDALTQEAYDGNESTFFKPTIDGGPYYINIDPSMIGKQLRLHTKMTSTSYCYGNYYILDAQNNVINSVNIGYGGNTEYNQIITIPNNAVRIKFGIQLNIVVYELQPIV